MRFVILIHSPALDRFFEMSCSRMRPMLRAPLSRIGLGLVRPIALASLLAGIALFNIHCAAAVAVVAPTTTPSPTVTRTRTPTAAPSNTPTQTATLTNTPTSTLTPSSTSTFTPVPTRTPRPTNTAAPIATLDPNARSARVPILLYHYIRPYPERAIDPLGYNLSVPPELFDQQLTYLQQQGFHTIRLGDLVNYLREGAPALPSKPIVLTFDDGYADAYVNAFPSLKERDMTGTFFIVTNFADHALTNYMNWEQIKEMQGAGMEIGAHTLDHVDLTLKSAIVAEQQIAGSQKVLQERLGSPITLFAYPYGRVNGFVADTTARYFAGAVTTVGGIYQTSQNIYYLRRIEISGAYGFNDFVRFLNYWLGR